MNSNSPSLSSSSLHLHVCPSIGPFEVTPTPLPERMGLRQRISHIVAKYPRAAVFVRQLDFEPILAGNELLYDDIMQAESCVRRFNPGHSGAIIINKIDVRIKWQRAEHSVVMLAWVLNTDRDRSFDKSTIRVMRSLTRLSQLE